MVDHPSPGADEVGLRHARDTVGLGDIVALVADCRVGDVELIEEAARVAGQILHVEAEEEHAARAKVPPAALQDWCLFAAGHAPRGPEAEDEGNAPQLGEAEFGAGQRCLEPLGERRR
jgi:hypothetical protein